ncbi:MAG: MFS transporter [Deltaproteobacteria bacterium]|nr:MFS transporter [Deltaproteobacteria bacterium]
MVDFKELKKRPIYVYLMVLTFGQAAAFLGWNALYTNFAVEVAHLTGQENGIIQSVRELPGLISIGAVALLFLVSENTLCSLAVIVCGLGVMITGWFPSFWGQLVWTFTLSMGFHYFEAINQSLGLQYFTLEETPVVLSRLRAVTAMGSFSMGLIIVCLAGRLDYRALFALAGSVAVIVGVWSIFRRPDRTGLPIQRRGVIVKRRYWLFYVLTSLSGARRQIFNVFAIFLLVEYFKFSLFQMSLLLLLNNLINWILNPYMGLAINAVGERKLLTIKYVAVFFLCLAYTVCDSAKLAAVLFVVDQISFCFTVSIRTYFQKVADPKDIAPSMALGVTVNHIVAVIVPFLGGVLWMVDRSIPFFMGAVFALASLVMTRFIDLSKQKIETAPGDGETKAQS